MEDLKTDLIRQVEQRVDLLRKEEDRLKVQLGEIEPKLEEARAMLQLIKTGKSALNTPSKLTKREDALAALRLFDGEFTSLEYADALEIKGPAAQRWLNVFEGDGLIYKIRESEMTTNGRTPTIWKVK